MKKIYIDRSPFLLNMHGQDLSDLYVIAAAKGTTITEILNGYIKSYIKENKKLLK